MTVITPAIKTNIYWPQNNEKYFYVRFCIIVDGRVHPVMEKFETYQEALDYLPKARKKQGFNNEENYNA